MLFGPNNSGKSSILQAIALVSQSSGGSISYNGDFVKLRDFDNVLFKGGDTSKIEFSFKFELNDEVVKLLQEKAKDGPFSNMNFREVEYYLRVGNKGIEFQRLKCIDGELCEVYASKRGESVSKFKYLTKEYRLYGNYYNVLGLGSYPGWRVGKVEESPSVSETVNSLCEIIGNRLTNIYYFSTMRGISQRKEKVSTPKRIGSHGENVLAFLHWIYSNKKDIFSKIVKWCKEFGIEDVISGLEDDQTYIAFKDPELNVDINIVDFGFGLNQLMPIICQCFVADKNSIIMVEEPEIHLHKETQYKLVELFVDVVKECKQIILTTHSPLIIRKLWRLVKDGKIGKDEISTYYVTKSDKGTEVKQANIDDTWTRLKKEYQDFLT